MLSPSAAPKLISSLQHLEIFLHVIFIFLIAGCLYIAQLSGSVPESIIPNYSSLQLVKYIYRSLYGFFVLVCGFKFLLQQMYCHYSSLIALMFSSISLQLQVLIIFSVCALIQLLMLLTIESQPSYFLSFVDNLHSTHFLDQ